MTKLFSADPKLRVTQHKVQVLLRAEVHWLLASQAKQQHYEDSMLAHLRQISLHGGNTVMTEFLSIVLTDCYVDRQPELISLLYDELDLWRPNLLATGPQPPSVGPSSNLGSAATGWGWATPPNFVHHLTSPGKEAAIKFNAHMEKTPVKFFSQFMKS